MTDDTTLEKIKDYAIKLALNEGVFNPSTIEIATAANVSRTLLHYYFKDKKEIHEIICSKAMELYNLKMQPLFTGSDTLYSRIILFAHNAFAISVKYPYLETFLITGMKYNPDLKCFFYVHKSKINALLEEIKNFVPPESLQNLQAEDFLMQLLSVVNLPTHSLQHIFPIAEYRMQCEVFTLHYKELAIKFIEESIERLRLK